MHALASENLLSRQSLRRAFAVGIHNCGSLLLEFPLLNNPKDLVQIQTKSRSRQALFFERIVALKLPV